MCEIDVLIHNLEERRCSIFQTKYIIGLPDEVKRYNKEVLISIDKLINKLRDIKYKKEVELNEGTSMYQ